MADDSNNTQPVESTGDKAPQVEGKEEIVSETKHSNNKVLVIVLIVVGALTLLGVAGTILAGTVFKKAGEAIVENATNTKITTNSDGTTTVESKDGSSSTSSSPEQKLPSDFPTGVPMYSGQKIIASTKLKNDNESYWNVTAETSDSVSRVAENAKKLYASWDSEGEQQYNDTYYLYFKKGDLKVNLYIFESDTKTNIQYSVTKTVATAE